MARLVVNPGSSAAWEIQLKPGANFIGRGFANDFKLTDPSVSGSHCQVIVSDRSVRIKDLGSTNGTYVNRAKIHEAPLLHGQAVHLGAVAMIFYADDTAPAGAAPAAPAAAQIPAAMPLPVAVPLRAAAGTPAPAAVPIAAPARVATGPAAPPLKTTVLPPRIPMPTSGARSAAVSSPVAAGAAPLALGGPHPCKHNPKTQGRFFCKQCQQYFCELCVNSRAAGNVQHKFCRHCGAECVPVQAPVRHVAAEPSFFSLLPAAFMYPLRGAGVLMLFVATILFAGLKLFGPGKFSVALAAMRGATWGFIAQVFFLGYLFTYLQNVIHSTAAGEKELPPLPGMADLWGDVVLPCLKLLGLVLFCFGPAFGLEWYVIASEESSVGFLVIPLAVLGGIYFPMAFLAVAMLDNVMAANPLQVVPSICKVPLEYFVTLVLLAAVWGIRALGDEVIPLVFPKGLLTHNMAKLCGYLGAEAFWALVCLYLLTVAMHILGLLYASKKDKLGWLSH